MKKIVNVQEVEGEGLVGLMGEVVLLMCSSYFYTGRLTGVNETCVRLDDASIVYETGDWNNPGFTDAQKLGSEPHYVTLQSIESFRKVS